MSFDDPLIALVATRNPVPTPEALRPEERQVAEELRRRIRSAPPPRRRGPRRYLLVVAAAILPVAAVLVVALGVHTLRHLATAAAQAPPQTILLIGSDHRAGTPFKDVNTDTILLLRLDPNSKTIKILSVPRDLKVQIPQVGEAPITTKLNAAYFYGGPALLIKILQQQVFPGLKVDHVIDFGFGGFAKIVDAIGCVYSDVDRRYYNNTAVTDYSSIDIQPGYQKLCGADALSFVRFRHTDSDVVRQARAQDFIRWARAQFTRDRVISEEGTLLRIFGENAVTDHSLRTTDGLINLFKLVASTLGRPVQSIPFPAIVLPCGGARSQNACYLTAPRSGEAAAYEQFITPTATPAPGTPPTVPASAPTSTGLVPDPADGQSQAAALRGAGLPVFYPRVIRAGSHYCSSVAGNCPLEVSDPHAYPREYEIDAAGRSYPAYRMTLVIHAEFGEYYGVQGTTWTDPPILAHPTRTELVNGKRLLEFYNGGKLSLVAWKTSGAAYWVSNTLTGDIPAGQLLAIAASLQPAR